MLSEKRTNASVVGDAAFCAPGKAMKKLILQKGTSGQGKDTFIGLKVVCAPAVISDHP